MTKYQQLMSVIDQSGGFYTVPVATQYRSHVNIPFRIAVVGEPNSELEGKFLSEAAERGLLQLKVHPHTSPPSQVTPPHPHTSHTYMYNHIYSTLFKTQERESDRRSKEIEQRKESQKHTQTKQQGHVTLSTELQSTALMLNSLQPQWLRKIFFKI